MFKNVFAALAKWIRLYRVFVGYLYTSVGVYDWIRYGGTENPHLWRSCIWKPGQFTQQQTVIQLLYSYLNRQAYSSHGLRGLLRQTYIYQVRLVLKEKTTFCFRSSHFCLTWCQIDESFGKSWADVRLMLCLETLGCFPVRLIVLTCTVAELHAVLSQWDVGVLFTVSWQVHSFSDGGKI